jgi:hypothetical protein
MHLHLDLHFFHVIMTAWATLLLFVLGLAFTARLNDEELLEKERLDYVEAKGYDRR